MSNELRELTDKELDYVSGGALETYNPGGQSQGASQVTYTSSGNVPPGQNKDLPAGIAQQVGL